MVSTDMIDHPIIWLASYSIVSTVVIMLILISRRKKTHKYKQWKKETINLGIYKVEFEPNPDEILQELWE